MIGPCPCAYACAYVDPVFHQSKLRHKHKHKHRKNELVRFSCAYAYAYVDPVFTCLHVYLCLCLCASENQALVWMRIGRYVFDDNENAYFWKRISVDRALVWTVENASKR